MRIFNRCAVEAESKKRKAKSLAPDFDASQSQGPIILSDPKAPNFWL